MKKVSIDQAVEILRAGDLVCLPTETVYGLAADGFNLLAIEKIFEAKGRPKENPLILHVDSLEMVERLVSRIPKKAHDLMKAFWPGPLTLVLDKSDIVPKEVTAGLSTVCVRMPKQPDTLAVINKLGSPIAAPSANRSGRPSPTNLEDLEKEMPDIAVLDGGQTELGLESTVVDARGDQVEILRLGGLPIEEIEKVLGQKVRVIGRDNTEIEIKSPGQMFKHYSPNGEVILIWPWESFGEKYAQANQARYTSVEEAYADLYDRFKCGIVASSEREKLYLGYEFLALGIDAKEQAKNLFQTLHRTESLGWEKVIVDMTGIDTNQALAEAVMERLKRAGS